MKMRSTGVVFGVSASPFLLNAVIYRHLQQYRDKYPDLVSTLMKSIYVNDVIYGADKEEEAYKLYVLSTNIFADLQMVDLICKICHLFIHLTSENSQISPADLYSNNSVIEEDTTYTSDLLTGNRLGGKKVLGISWHPISDVLEFDVAISLHTNQA